jgi:four helix bundle protein
MQDFKKLTVWQKSYRLGLDVYVATRGFPKEELYGLTSQIRRASVSIPANIAEGCGRHTGSEFARFLDIAMGSISELDCHLMFARDLSYIREADYSKLDENLVEVRRMLIAFIQTVRHSA